jgi:hypothetical protein
VYDVSIMKIVTAVVNNPQFIEIQYYTLKKYFKGDYEFIVFNDAKLFPDFTNSGDASIKTQIDDLCASLDIQCISIPNDHHREVQAAHVRTADSMNFILKYQKEHPDKYLLLDSDMFLMDDFDVSKYADYDAAIVLQSRDNDYYIWNGIYYFDFTKLKHVDLINWDCTWNCDTGGRMQEWLRTQLSGVEVSYALTHTHDVYFMKWLSSIDWDLSTAPQNVKKNPALVEFLQNDFRNENGKFFCELYDGAFLHYRAGGNWRNEGMDAHRRLTQALKNVLI